MDTYKRDEWRSIETAPKDGTRVLLIRRDEQFVGAYREAMRGQPAADIGECWRALCCGRVAAPTHWMPLPEPPADALLRARSKE